MLGTKVGLLKVLEDTGRTTTRGSTIYLCLCECGSLKEFSQAKLEGRRGSCGCLISTPTYVSWQTMWQRCTNPHNKDYRYYGGRGVSVCGRWESYSNFVDDMGRRPSGCSLDRVNSDGNYEPANCRWATTAEQARNRKGIKLDPDSARFIRNSPAPQSVLAKAFGVHQTVISRVKNNKRWVTA